jgi:hypothetical protein
MFPLAPSQSQPPLRRAPVRARRETAHPPDARGALARHRDGAGRRRSPWPCSPCCSGAADSWLLTDAVYDNPAFAIQRVDVRTDGVIAPAVIRRWAMVRPGQNLLSLDLMRVKRDLEMYSPIAGVCVERVLPGTLRISVTERQPVAQAITLQPRRGGGFNAVTNDFDGDREWSCSLWIRPGV